MREYHAQKYKEYKYLEDQVRFMRTNNGQIFMGGYTEPAKMSYDAREKQIAMYEKEKQEELALKWNFSVDSIKTFQQNLEKQKREVACMSSSSTGPGVPRVGGLAAVHAVSHGGGFNHPGVYAGNVFF